MIKIVLNSILALGFLFSFVRCDKVCNKTVEDFAVIQNTTGRSLSLSVCKGRTLGETQAVIPTNTLDNQVSLGTRQSAEAVGGPTASCSSVSNSKNAVGISLSPNSFGQVKLCKDQDLNRYVVVESSQGCPTGLIEQTSTGPCDNNSQKNSEEF